MSEMIIFCVESNSHSNSDYIYIMETIHRFYKLDNQINIQKINTGSKTKYNSKEVAKKIPDSEKVKEAAKFRKNKTISRLEEDKLRSKDKHSNRSNILTILDKYLKSI